MDVYSIIEKARKTGKVEKGTNEVTKAIERGTAKFVVIAKDTQPKEITQHIPILCKEKKIPCEEADSKEKLGIAAGIKVACSSGVKVLRVSSTCPNNLFLSIKWACWVLLTSPIVFDLCSKAVNISLPPGILAMPNLAKFLLIVIGFPA